MGLLDRQTGVDLTPEEMRLREKYGTRSDPSVRSESSPPPVAVEVLRNVLRTEKGKNIMYYVIYHMAPEKKHDHGQVLFCRVGILGRFRDD